MKRKLLRLICHPAPAWLPGDRAELFSSKLARAAGIVGGCLSSVSFDRQTSNAAWWPRLKTMGATFEGNEYAHIGQNQLPSAGNLASQLDCGPNLMSFENCIILLPQNMLARPPDGPLIR